MADLISIIVPCFNAERFIGNAINSVKMQTYTNWELIIVDDHSTDKTWELVNTIAKDDKRIKLLRANINNGPAKTRNIGIDASSGDFLAFLDSDDTLKPNFLKRLIYAVNTYSADIVWCQFEEFYSDKTSRLISNLIPKNQNISQREGLKLLFQDIQGSYALWNKLFRKDLITSHHIRFNERRFRGEDMQFVIEVFQSVNSIVCIDDPLYNHIIQNSNSIMASYRENDLPLMLETISLFQNIADKYDLDPGVGYYARHAKSILEQIFLISKKDPENAKALIKSIKKSKEYLFAEKDISRKILPLSYWMLSKLIRFNSKLAVKFARLR